MTGTSQKRRKENPDAATDLLIPMKRKYKKLKHSE